MGGPGAVAPHLVVMAAGLGSRYGGLKQMDPIGPGGEIILDYAVYDARRAGFAKVVFVLRRDLEEAFREQVGRRIEPHIDTAYVFQELVDLPGGFTPPPERSKPWGTAQAVLCARREVPQPFAAINADDFYGPDAFRRLYGQLAQARDSGGVGDYCLVGYRLDHTLSEHGHVARGVCQVTPAGELEDIVEQTRVQRFADEIKVGHEDGRWTAVPAGRIASMNIWGFTPGFFDHLEQAFREFLAAHGRELQAECYLPTVVSRLIRGGRARVRVLPTDEHWFGMTYPADKETAQRAIRARIAAGQYSATLWS